VGGLLLWLALPLFARLNLHRPLQHRGFRTPIGLEDLRALRQVEEAIPPEDGVIIPAEHANIANWEHWVLPLGSTGRCCPTASGVPLQRLHRGELPLSWRDLDEGLCSSDPAARARFLERTRIRWALVNDPGAADAAAALERPQMCSGHDVPLSALGAELPPCARAGHLPVPGSRPNERHATLTTRGHPPCVLTREGRGRITKHP